ncbi:MAG: DUF302 domain-containing protein [Gemmatimonadota bacterium]
MSSTDPRYGIGKTVDLSVDEADRKIRDALADEGFGILTEIDVKETLKKKLDVDFRPYRILGACNPSLAHKALGEEIDIGLLLPCNVIVYEGEEEGTSVVSVIDPVVQLGVADREELAPVAEEVRERMRRALGTL